MKSDRDTQRGRGKFDPHSVFKEILSGQRPASFVYRDEQVSALMDVQPITAGHVLIIPNTPAASLAELDPEVGGHMFRVGQRIGAAIRRTDLRCEGINFFLADGAAAGQTVFHVHLHVFPRYAGDGFGWKLPDTYNEPPSRGSLDTVAETIKQAM